MDRNTVQKATGAALSQPYIFSQSHLADRDSFTQSLALRGAAWQVLQPGLSAIKSQQQVPQAVFESDCSP